MKGGNGYGHTNGTETDYEEAENDPERGNNLSDGLGGANPG